MAREKYELAEQDYMNGMKYKDIADKYGVSLNTVKSWKKRYNWDRKGCTQKKKKGAHKNAIAQLGNKNATGPAGNKNAEKYGFFSKYLPEETLDIVQAVEKANPLDLLWHQIQIAYAAIIRAQRIAFVENEYDKTIEQVEVKKGNIVGAKWEVQQAWDKQNNFLKAQARAQGELRSLIKQYDEMLHRDWDMATEEQKSRVEYIKSKTAAVNKALTGEGAEIEDVDDLEEEIYGSTET